MLFEEKNIFARVKLRFAILFFMTLVGLSGFSQTNKVRIVNFTDLEPAFHFQNDTTYIINFWATWCVPCVRELPHFEELNATYSTEKVKMILVSLDFSDQLDKRLIPFIEKKGLEAEVVLLDDPDANSWIPKVDKNWSGAIPATYIYKGNKSLFHEGSLDKESLNKMFLSMFKS